MNAQVKAGDRIDLHFELKVEGEVVHSTNNGDPVQVVAGSSDTIKGLSNGIIGMSVRDKKTLDIPSQDAYGPRDESLVLEVDRDQLPAEAEMGHILESETGESWIVLKVAKDRAVVDGNHPLAGRDITVVVNIVANHGQALESKRA